MTKHLVTNRRAFMRLIGAAGAATMLPSLWSRGARAAGSAIPKRVLFVYGMGSIKEFYAPTSSGGGPATVSDFVLGELHTPLAQYKNDLIVLDGLDMRSVHVDPTAGANGHVNGGTHALTGVNRLTPSLANGVSIDQFIAAQLNSPAPVTKYPMWEADMGGTGDVEGGPSYFASGQVNPRYYNLTDVLPLFPADLGAQSAEQQAAIAVQLAKRRSTLSYALAEYSAMMPRLSSGDQNRLQQHAQTMRQLSDQLGLGSSVECAPPDQAMSDAVHAWNPMASGTTDQQAAAVLQKADLMSKLFVEAFSCDLTRVGLLHLPTHYDLEPVIGFQAGMFGGTSDSHDLTHKTADPTTVLWNDPDAMAMVKKVHTNQSQLIANLIGYLKAVPEADGSTLFDHTVIVWCGQLGQGNHNVDHLPWMLAGSAGGYFKTGRYVKFDRGSKDQGPAHNDLFVSVANAMGIGVDTFGNAAVCNGALPGLT